jgi:hypothetical protein
VLLSSKQCPPPPPGAPPQALSKGMGWIRVEALPPSHPRPPKEIQLSPCHRQAARRGQQPAEILVEGRGGRVARKPAEEAGLEALEVQDARRAPAPQRRLRGQTSPNSRDARRARVGETHGFLLLALQNTATDNSHLGDGGGFLVGCLSCLPDSSYPPRWVPTDGDLDRQLLRPHWYLVEPSQCVS